MNYEFNLLHHVGVVAKRVRAAAAEMAAHEGDDNTPSGRRGKNVWQMHTGQHWLVWFLAFIIGYFK